MNMDDVVICYDNGGDSCDRYTVLFRDAIDGTHQGRGMSAQPSHPQGFGQWLECEPGDHLGKPIPFNALPDQCREVIENDYKSLNP